MLEACPRAQAEAGVNVTRVEVNGVVHPNKITFDTEELAVFNLGVRILLDKLVRRMQAPYTQAAPQEVSCDVS